MTHLDPQGVTHDHWVYLAYDAEDRLLYVGITSHGIRRFRGHARRSAWWPDVARFEIEHFEWREEALAHEEELIVARRPLHNITHAGKAPEPMPPIPLPPPLPDGEYPSRWLSLPELASVLDLEPAVIDAGLENGMPYAVIAGNVRFKADKALAWLNAKKSKPNSRRAAA